METNMDIDYSVFPKRKCIYCNLVVHDDDLVGVGLLEVAHIKCKQLAMEEHYQEIQDIIQEMEYD